jgi:GT2 family glycosyltransferase
MKIPFQNRVEISCIIPTVGRDRILCATIGMLLAQTHAPHQIIVVDQTVAHDEATDTSLAAWQAKGAIQWIHQTEPNASMARNTGALHATGNILLFLDDDIIVQEDFLEAYVRAFHSPDVAGVAGQLLVGEGKLVHDLPAGVDDPDCGWLRFPKNYSKPCVTSWMISANVAVRRDIFISLGGMDENYRKGAMREEGDFAMRFARAGYRFHFEPKASVFHLGHPIGGARIDWLLPRLQGWEHWIGDWYFTLGYANRRNVFLLLRSSLRHFVFNRYNVFHPWWLPVVLVRWIWALPVALVRRLRGAKLIQDRLSKEAQVPASGQPSGGNR